jgi:hypothetical protein
MLLLVLSPQVLAIAFEVDPIGILGHAMELAKDANNDVLKYRTIKAMWRLLSPDQKRAAS